MLKNHTLFIIKWFLCFLLELFLNLNISVSFSFLNNSLLIFLLKHSSFKLFNCFFHLIFIIKILLYLLLYIIIILYLCLFIDKWSYFFIFEFHILTVSLKFILFLSIIVICNLCHSNNFFDYFFLVFSFKFVETFELISSHCSNNWKIWIWLEL